MLRRDCDSTPEEQSTTVPEGHKKPASDRAIEHKTRQCLVCRSPFPSAWAGERICPRCKSTPAWRSGVLR